MIYRQIERDEVERYILTEAPVMLTIRATFGELVAFGIPEDLAEQVSFKRQEFMIVSQQSRSITPQICLRLMHNYSYLNWWYKCEWVFIGFSEEEMKNLEAEKMELQNQKEVIARLLKCDNLATVETTTVIGDDDTQTKAKITIISDDLLSVLKLFVAADNSVVEDRCCFRTMQTRYKIKNILSTQISSNERVWFIKSLLDNKEAELSINQDDIFNLKGSMRALPNLLDKIIRIIRDSNRKYTIKVKFEEEVALK